VKKLYRSSKIYTFAFTVLLVVLIVEYFYLHFIIDLHSNFFDLLFLPGFVVFGLEVSFTLRLYIYTKTAAKIDIGFHRLLNLSAIILTFCLAAFFEIRNTLSYKFNMESPKYSVSLALKNEEELQTNDSILFVGNTRNFMFFKNKSSNESIIVPLTEVEQIKKHLLREGL
jgi:hypothetical protein